MCPCTAHAGQHGAHGQMQPSATCSGKFAQHEVVMYWPRDVLGIARGGGTRRMDGFRVWVIQFHVFVWVRAVQHHRTKVDVVDGLKCSRLNGGRPANHNPGLCTPRYGTVPLYMKEGKKAINCIMGRRNGVIQSQGGQLAATRGQERTSNSVFKEQMGDGVEVRVRHGVAELWRRQEGPGRDLTTCKPGRQTRKDGQANKLLFYQPIQSAHQTFSSSLFLSLLLFCARLWALFLPSPLLHWLISIPCDIGRSSPPRPRLRRASCRPWAWAFRPGGRERAA